MDDQMDSSALARAAIDRRLDPIRSSDLSARPSFGWIRAIRDALGMTSRQLAARMGRSQSTLSAIEKGEAEDTVTLATLRAVARAMDCSLVYALVPNKPLDTLVRDRARLVAGRQLGRLNQTMRLEDQALAADDMAAARERMIDNLLLGDLRRLWDEA